MEIEENILPFLIEFSNNLLLFNKEPNISYQVKYEAFIYFLNNYFPLYGNYIYNNFLQEIKILEKSINFFYNLDNINLEQSLNLLDSFKNVNYNNLNNKSLKLNNSYLSVNVKNDLLSNEGSFFRYNSMTIDSNIINKKLKIKESLSDKSLKQVLLNTNINEFLIMNDFKDKNDFKNRKNSFTLKEDDKKLFFNIFEQNSQVIQEIISLLKNICFCFSKLENIYKNNLENNEICIIFTEKLFKELFEKEKNIKQIIKKCQIFENNFIYARNSFIPILNRLIEDSFLFFYLIKAYKANLSMDVINAMNYLNLIKKNTKKINTNEKQIKLYLFYIHFNIDNEEKFEFLFNNYLENKRLKLINYYNNSQLKSNNIKINLNSVNEEKEKIKKSNDNINIKEIILNFPINNKNDFNIKILSKELDLIYFIFIFDIEKYLELSSYEKKDINYKQNLFKNVFIENDKKYGISHILFKNNIENILNDFNKILNPKDKDNLLLNINNEKNNEYLIYKLENNNSFIFYPISNYLYISIKFIEKNKNEIKRLLNLCKNYKMRFNNYHILKTLIL